MYDYDVELVSATGVVTILPGAHAEVEVFQLPAVTVLDVVVPGPQGATGPQGLQGVQGLRGDQGDIDIDEVEAAFEPPVQLSILFENAIA